MIMITFATILIDWKNFNFALVFILLVNVRMYFYGIMNSKKKKFWKKEHKPSKQLSTIFAAK